MVSLLEPIAIPCERVEEKALCLYLEGDLRMFLKSDLVSVPYRSNCPLGPSIDCTCRSVPRISLAEGLAEIPFRQDVARRQDGHLSQRGKAGLPRTDPRSGAH